MNRLTRSKLDSFFNKKYDFQKVSPGFAFCILKKGKVFYEKYFGYADLRKKIKINKNTNFRLASVTKQFTALCILRLIEKGKIKFSTKLTEIFPKFPKYAKEITIYHLLTHSSGLKQYEKIIKNKKIKENLNDDKVFKIISKEKKLLFTPGEKFDYNNGGYCLLRLIIEKLSKLKFENFLKKEIFNQLNMKNSTTNQNKKIKNRAYGYSINKKFFKSDQNQTSRTLGDGGIYSSTKDLIQWCNELNKKTLLSKKLYKKYETPQKNSRGKFLKEKNYGRYSFGWYVKDNQIIFHGGESVGFRTCIYRIPKKKISLIFLSNFNKYEGSKLCAEIYGIFKN